MGRIVANFFMSLDGVVEAPDQWHFPYFDDEMGAAVGSGMASTKAFLMGRVLYDEWAAYWPAQGDDETAAFFNTIPKYVVSRSRPAADWTNSTVVPADAAAIRSLKQDVDGDIGMSGSATTVRWLLADGLLDELNLLIHPIVVGHGQRLFEDTATHPLTLLRSTAFGSGVLHAVYAPAPE